MRRFFMVLMLGLVAVIAGAPAADDGMPLWAFGYKAPPPPAGAPAPAAAPAPPAAPEVARTLRVPRDHLHGRRFTAPTDAGNRRQRSGSSEHLGL